MVFSRKFWQAIDSCFTLRRVFQLLWLRRTIWGSWLCIRRGAEGIGCVVISYTVLAFEWKDWGKQWKTSVMISGPRAEIESRVLPNTNQDWYIQNESQLGPDEKKSEMNNDVNMIRSAFYWSKFKFVFTIKIFHKRSVWLPRVHFIVIISLNRDLIVTYPVS
jgi:hypothetical protein